jgi:hypothetical protein
MIGGQPVADDFNREDFWDGEEEEGYFDEKRFPRVWLLSMGILSVILVVGVVALAFLALFQPPPTPTLDLSPSTLPPSTSVTLPGEETETEATPTPVMVQSTLVPLPSTSTPVPAVPQEIAIGVYVQVSGTGGGDLSFRAGPGTNYARLKIIAEGAVLKVLDGPSEADGYVWWQLQDVSDGMVGWAVADYLEPTVP